MSDKGKGQTLIKDALALFAITLIAALLLGMVNEVTKEPIAEQKASAKAAAYKAVFHEADSIDMEDADIIAKVSDSKSLLESASLSKVAVNEAGIARDASGKALGYVMTVTSANGYGGDVTITMGFTADKKITRIEFLTLNETAGLGMKAKDAAFKNQYSGKSGQVLLSVTKAGAKAENEIDAISAATITSDAVTEAVNGGIVFATDLLGNGIGGVSQ